VSDANLVSIQGNADKGVSFLVGGGLQGNIYQLGLVATTSLGQNKVSTLNLQITVDSNGVASAAAYWPYGVGWPAGFIPSSGGMTPVGSTQGNGPGAQNFAEARVSVGTSPVSALAARSGRISARFKNVGTTNIEISQQSSFAIGSGMQLKPDEWVPLDTQAAVYAVSDAAGGSLAVQETW
jgi:hypothetical protein